MTGSPAERNLLGAVILDPRQVRMLAGIVNGSDFEDGRLGTVFDRISEMAIRGVPVTPETLDDKFPDWGVLGLPRSVAFSWADVSNVLAYEAPDYGRSVRADSMRRSLRALVSIVSESVNEGRSPSDVASTAMSELAALVDGASSGLLRTKTLAEILEGSDSYDWVIPNLLERKDRLIVTGPEGSGKTTWVRQLAVLSAAGMHPTTFQHIDPVRVLVVDAENTERQWRRAVRWMAQRAKESGLIDPTPEVHIVAGNRIDITRGSHLGEIHRLIDRHKPDVLFIGPLYKLVPKAITNDDDASPLIVGLDSLRERNIALVMEAHAGKASGADGSRDLRPRGSAALLGWPEFGLGLRPDPDSPGSVEVIRWRGDRDQRDWPKRMYRGVDWPWQP